MRPLPHTHSCFVCGDANSRGLKLRFETDGRLVRASFRPDLAHSGFKGVVHGGIIATVLDEIMVWACVVATRRFAYCAELNVRYLRPLSPEMESVVTGELTQNRKGRIFEARAALRDAAGQTHAEASGKYLPVPEAALTGFAGDLVGEAEWLRSPPG